VSIAARFRVERPGFLLDVDLSLPARGVTAVFGPSGCGKTTLLRAIAGLERDPGGLCRVGENLWQDGARLFVPTHRRPLGYVFQEASLFAHLSVRGNLEYGLKRVPESERRVTLDEAAALLGVERLLARRPEGLSGGERQRVAVARALLTSPRLLLMDEPLAALDRASKRDILPYLERLRDELAMPVLYVSHAPDEVARLAHHLVLLEAGRVRAAGPIVELLTRLDLAREQGIEAEAVVEARVAEHDPTYHLTYLDFAGGRFSLVHGSLPLGRKVRLRVLARDVSITLEPPTGTSILNRFPAVVDDLAEDGPAQVLVRLDLAGTPILARITRKSAAVLALAPGKRVHAQVKTVALLD
jgi:molybdate transport system ATP-binding protein